MYRSILMSCLSARTKLKPYLNWHLGSGTSGRNPMLKLRWYLWRRSRGVFVVNWFNNLKIHLYPKNEISRAIFLTGYYEPNQFAILNKILKPGMTFIDAGANMGLYTLFAASKVCDHGAVLAIEPSYREFQRLVQQVNLNALVNVHCLQIALSNKRSKAELLVAVQDYSGHNTLGDFGYNIVHSSGTEVVSTDKLDYIVQNEGLQQVDIIKMDIEGAEFFALQGAIETINQFHPIILLELSDRSLEFQGCNSGQVWNFLTRMGYQIYTYSSDTGLPVLAQQQDYFDSENIIAVHKLFREHWLW